MNHKRYRNSLRLPLVVALVAVTVFCVSIALSFVLSRNRIHALSEEQRQIEQEMRLLHQEITALDRRIDGLLTRDRVQSRLASAGTMLQKINNQHVIYLTPPPSEAPMEATPHTP
jgi:hypothetical protein